MAEREKGICYAQFARKVMDTPESIKKQTGRIITKRGAGAAIVIKYLSLASAGMTGIFA